jgi:hypothetical protein
MSHPISLSDELVLDAQLTAELAERSIAGQIEFWAQLGRAVEGLLQGAQALALRRAGKARPLSKCLEEVDTEAGRVRVKEHLSARPYPHYESAPNHPGQLVRIEKDGSRTRGRFVGREFQVSE